MVSNYKRKANRGAWNEKNMERALQAVTEKRMGWLKASRHFQVHTSSPTARCVLFWTTKCMEHAQQKKYLKYQKRQTLLSTIFIPTVSCVSIGRIILWSHQ
ncbi:unnamed protein product [Acanthoscelides obtectus]|uniref:Uncharacterized protein n=1 Tax=Acanthoscelides obtectus TaxID=200917 RepID=A0A9P0K3C3_ACAOB|nr:unnamed protein product [Acanthoscelides obtectus]CAK1622725.1 hypothetical protein AOBTE_LOCUS1643 [Acanthoscelides obtectus]